MTTMKKQKTKKIAANTVESNPFKDLLKADLNQSVKIETKQVDDLTETVKSLKAQVDILIPEVKKLRDEMEYRTEYLRRQIDERPPTQHGISICRVCGRPDCRCPDRVIVRDEREARDYERRNYERQYNRNPYENPFQ